MVAGSKKSATKRGAKSNTMKSAEYSMDDGKFLIGFAHETIDNYVGKGASIGIPDVKPKFLQPRGVFVTLNVKGDLRGCIGHPVPAMPLIEAVRDLSIASATEDFRFSSISERELKDLRVEVSILTVPEELKLKDRKDAPRSIKIGRDGLIIEFGWNKGLLLPQVAAEEKWDSEEFLRHTCWKAGLPEDKWLDPKARIFTFQSLIFTEGKDRKVTVTNPE